MVNLNGYEYRNTVGVMGGKHMVSVSATVRDGTGLNGGDPVHVKLTLAETPREVDVPDDLADALSAEPGGGSVLRQAPEQPAALPRRQHQRHQDPRDETAACGEGALAVPRGKTALSGRSRPGDPPSLPRRSDRDSTTLRA